MMNEKIIKLDERTINLIAAGEVVENPASIIKELLENSIDAHASSIVIEIKNGGKSYIRVTDDGYGIEEKDISLAFERHTTSKITKFEDFDNLHTNGFRGEALGSIAAVSKVTAISKKKEQLFGVHMTIAGGQLQESHRTGAKDGTTIIVEDLFYNTPARKKFLKSTQSETSKITDIIIHLSLANPHIKFKYINNNKVMLTSVGNSSLYDTIQSIFQEEFRQGLVRLSETHDKVKLEGYLGHNTLMFSSRRNQYIFVNGRVVRSKDIIDAIEEAYDPFIPVGNFPAFMLNIIVHPSIVDVNIHPNKLDIKFDKESRVLESVTEIISEKLRQLVMIPKIAASTNQNAKIPDEPIIDNLSIADLIEKTLPPKEQETPVLQQTSTVIYPSKYTLESQIKEEETNIPIVDEPAPVYEIDFDYQKSKFIGVLFDTYFIAEWNDSIYLVDQHAAHERILYEKYRSAFLRQEINTQTLLSAIQIKLPLILFDLKEEIVHDLLQCGFFAEIFGANSIAIRGIPTIFSLEQAEKFIEEMIDIRAGSTKKSVILDDAIAMKACKAAIKAHDRLKKEEIETVMKQLYQCENKYACPHGRPVIIEISKYEIEKMFKRVLK